MLNYKEYIENLKRSNMRMSNRVIIKTQIPLTFINSSNNPDDKNYLDNNTWLLGLLIFLNSAEGNGAIEFKSTKYFGYTADAKQLLKQLGKNPEVAEVIKTNDMLVELDKQGAIENITAKTGEKSQNGLDIYKFLPIYDIDNSYYEYVELENLMIYYMLDALDITEVRILLRSITIDKALHLDIINTHKAEEVYKINNVDFKAICDNMVKQHYWIPAYDLRGNFVGYDCKIYETLEGNVAKVKKADKKRG